jgi:hypothetical protein
VNQNGVLCRVSDTGGSPISVGGLGGAGKQISYRFPWFLPDGRHFLFQSTAVPAPPNQATIRVGSLERETKLIAEADSNAVFVQGRLLYVRDKTLIARPFDPRRLATTGDSVPLEDQVSVFSGLGNFLRGPGRPLVYMSAPHAFFELAIMDVGRKTAISVTSPHANASMADSPSCPMRWQSITEIRPSTIMWWST